MKKVVFIGLCCALFSSSALAKESLNSIVIPASGKVAVTINGISGEVVVSPDGPTFPTFSPDLAQSAGLSGGVFGVDASIGSQVIHGKSGVANLIVNNATYRRRVIWFEKAILPGAGGNFGPGALPSKRVTFTIHPATGNERPITLPLIRDGSFLGTSLPIGGKPVFVTWNLQAPFTVATAAAGQVIANAQGGVLRGESVQREIRFGVGRPTREMELARPLSAGGVSLDALVVRSADYGRVDGIPDEATDPGEIIVTATGKKTKPRYMLTIGKDALRSCTSISFDLQAKKITLLCAP